MLNIGIILSLDWETQAMGTIQAPLENIAATSQPENIAIFIADSMRFDALPDVIADRGISGRAIAPSTYTGNSIPSLISGFYPAEHKVWHFDKQLARKPLLLQATENTGFNAETIWTHLESAEKPPLRMVRASPGEPIERLSEPFVYIEHDKGGHTPYGYSYAECDSSQEFYKKHVDDPSEVPGLYAQSIENACERFVRMLDTLEDRGILDKTLVVFTADHGELLGEPERGHIYGHGRPMTPEVVDIPLLFIGAGLPKGETYSNVLSGVDIVPTALGALGRTVPNRLPGRDLWTHPPKSRAHRCDVWMKSSLKGKEFTSYQATSLWSDRGGLVRHMGSRALRLAQSHYHHFKAAPHDPVFRSQWSVKSQAKLLELYLPSTVRYGPIDPILTEQKETLPEKFEEGTQLTENQEKYSKERLKELGYV